jgi:polyisoprenoid-binding protein YceI
MAHARNETAHRDVARPRNVARTPRDGIAPLRAFVHRGVGPWHRSAFSSVVDVDVHGRCLIRSAALTLLASLLAAPRVAAAASEVYGVRLPSDGLVVEVPYSLGTHHEHVTEVDGRLRIDPERLGLESSRLIIPIASFRSDDAQRGCHLREALGLDYTRSHFPREHVCDDRNRLPASGPDAIAFPEIVLDLTRGRPVASDGGQSGEVDAEGTLTVHGVSRPIHLRLALSRPSPGSDLLRVRGRVPLRLSEFGVTVKSARVLFVSISVRDEVTIAVDALLEPVGAGARPHR